MRPFVKKGALMQPLSRRWRLTVWVGYIGLVGLALALRLLMYDRFLPLLDYSDESNMFLLSVYMRGDEVQLAGDYGAAITGNWLAGYPPLFPWLGVWGQRLVETTTSQFLFPGDYIGAMRLMAVAASVLTVVVLLAVGWSVARPLGAGWAAVAGMFTALPYALAPQIIDIGILAIPDSFIPLACAVALLGAVRAITRDAPLWLVWSLLGAVAAIYLKYSLLFTLWLTFCGVVVLIWQRGLRAMLPWLGGLAAISALTAGYLIWGYGALGLQNKESQWFRENGLANALSVDRNLTNFFVSLDVSMGAWLFAAVLAAGIAGYILAERNVNARWLWLLVPFIIGNVLLTSSVVYTDLERGGYGRVRYMFPAAMALSLVWALCVVQVGLWLRRRALVGSVIALVALVFAVPALNADAQLIRRYAQPDTNLLLWQWSDASIPPEGKILVARRSRAHLVWNRPYSGYTGQTTFDWVHDDNPAQGTPQDAYDAGIAYFVFTERDRQQIYNTDAMSDFIDQLYPLKTIPADGAHGETTHVYRMLPPDKRARASFGERIEMVGYDLSADTVAPGDTLTFRPYWRATQTPQANYSMFVHLYPAGDPTQVIVQFDGAPVTEARLPTTWTDPDENLIGADVTLTVPPDTPPGDYTLAVGLYDFQTGARLPVGEGDRYEIPVQVTP